ncbi:MAG TPA: nitrilase-related carbon-nitrogen hydrolase [Gemmatimonadales bacterium]|nr:nitrilase-related carbon-nitrogen hydrolase [Gemmatimonadales bacterium]
MASTITGTILPCPQPWGCELQAPRSPGWPAVVLILASAALFFAGTGLSGVGALVWLAPVPVLVLAPRLSAVGAACAAFAAYLLGGLNLASYLYSLAPLPLVAAALIVPAVVLAGAVLLGRRAVGVLPAWAAALAFPAAWTTYEFLLARLSPNGTFGSLAYTQVDFLPVLQLASVTGIWGVTFLLCLVPAGIAAAWTLRARPTQAGAALILPALALTVTLVFGSLRLATPETGGTVSVGLATTDASIDRFNTTNWSTAQPVVAAYANRVRLLGQRGARIVVLPEKFVGVTARYLDSAVAILGDAARAGHVSVVAGFNLLGGPEKRNIAAVIDPDGNLMFEYDKRHMLPGFEAGYRVGPAPAILDLPGGRAGIAICKDLDFPEWTRLYAEVGSNILLVPAWDFGRDRRLHSRMAIVRGVEDGLPIVRSAQDGLATVSDDRGRILVEAASASAPEVLLTAQAVPLGDHSTLYVRLGDWFGWTSGMLLMVLLGGVLVQDVRARPAHSAGRAGTIP